MYGRKRIGKGEWLPISTAPRTGETIEVRAVWGGNDEGPVSFQGQAQWRVVRIPWLLSSTGEVVTEMHDIEGWMRVNENRAIAGRVMGWRKLVRWNV